MYIYILSLYIIYIVDLQVSPGRPIRKIYYGYIPVQITVLVFSLQGNVLHRHVADIYYPFFSTPVPTFLT